MQVQRFRGWYSGERVAGWAIPTVQGGEVEWKSGGRKRS